MAKSKRIGAKIIGRKVNCYTSDSRTVSTLWTNPAVCRLCAKWRCQAVHVIPGRKSTIENPLSWPFQAAAGTQELFAPWGRGGKTNTQPLRYTLNRTVCKLATGAHDQCAHTLHRWVGCSLPRHHLPPPCAPHSLWSKAQQTNQHHEKWFLLSRFK